MKIGTRIKCIQPPIESSNSCLEMGTICEVIGNDINNEGQPTIKVKIVGSNKLAGWWLANRFVKI